MYAWLGRSCKDCNEDMQDVTPSMEEISLLREALKQLDQPFLVVIVGEFNSGKSTVINALLGTKFLADGILPTTNEISVLKFRCAFVSPALQPGRHAVPGSRGIHDRAADSSRRRYRDTEASRRQISERATTAADICCMLGP